MANIDLNITVNLDTKRIVRNNNDDVVLRSFSFTEGNTYTGNIVLFKDNAAFTPTTISGTIDLGNYSNDTALISESIDDATYSLTLVGSLLRQYLYNSESKEAVFNLSLTVDGTEYDLEVVSVNITASPSENTGEVTWEEVVNKPTSFEPSTHTHPISGVDGLTGVLSGKADVGHTHDYSNGALVAYNVQTNFLEVPNGDALMEFSNDWIAIYKPLYFGDQEREAQVRANLGLGTAATMASGSFAPSTHTHPISGVNGLPEALSSFVTTTGNQSISGNKTFSGATSMLGSATNTVLNLSGNGNGIILDASKDSTSYTRISQHGQLEVKNSDTVGGEKALLNLMGPYGSTLFYGTHFTIPNINLKDNTTLYLVRGGGKVAVGTYAGEPLSKLVVNGNQSIGTSNGFVLANAPTAGLIVEGNVGIGTAAPTEKLHLSGNALIGGNVTTTGNISASGTITAPNATGTGATSIANVSALDIRYGAVAPYSSFFAQLPDSTSTFWEKGITALSGNGSVATITLNSNAAVGSYLSSGEMVYIGGASPAAWNGLYKVLSFDNSVTITIETNKTDTYTANGKIAIARPLLKFAPTAYGTYQGHLDFYGRKNVEAAGEAATKSSCDFTVGFDASSNIKSIEALWGNTSQPAWTIIGRTAFFAGALYGSNTVYLVGFRYWYNQASKDSNYQRAYFRVDGVANGLTPVVCGTGDFLP